MQKEKLDHFRRKLLALRASYEEQLETLRRGGLSRTLRDFTAELSSLDNHPADLGSELFERSKDLALRDYVVLQLKKIEEALDNIRRGTYGRCTRCGRQIPPERLEASPETDLCLECRQAVEREDRARSRPVEEEVVGRKPSFEDELEYDGEDTWQDLARTAEHAPDSGSGAYYGPLDLDEDRGYVELVDGIPYFKGEDGMFYQDHVGYVDDEGMPGERMIGGRGWDRVED